MGRGLLLRGASVSLASVVVLSCLFNLCMAWTLPPELQGAGYSVITAMRMHFCMGPGNSCQQMKMTPMSLCWYLCDNTESVNTECGNSSVSNNVECSEPESQTPYCYYNAAIVCRYNDRRGSCVYSNTSTFVPFCICRDSSGLFPETPTPMRTCSQAVVTDPDTPAVGTSESGGGGHQLTASSAPNTERGGDGTEPSTGSTADTHRPTTASPEPSADNQPLGSAVSASTVVLAVALAVLLLLFLLLVVLWRRGTFEDRCGGTPRKPSEASGATAMNADVAGGLSELGRPMKAAVEGALVAEESSYSQIGNQYEGVDNKAADGEAPGATGEGFYHTLEHDAPPPGPGEDDRQ